jgi:hypothetical protein
LRSKILKSDEKNSYQKKIVQSAYDENCLAFWGQSIVFHMYRCFLYGH